MADSFETLEQLKSNLYQTPQSYNVNNIYWAKISDSNLQDFAQGSIKFNVQNLYSGSASETPLYELSEGYIQLYMVHTLEAIQNDKLGADVLDAATFPDMDALQPVTNTLPINLQSQANVFQTDNKNALAVKSPIMLVNQVLLNMSGIEVISSPNQCYLYNTIKLRKGKEEQNKFKNCIDDNYVDSANSMIYDDAVGEINNISSQQIAKQVYHIDDWNDKNKRVNRKFVVVGSKSGKIVDVSNFTETELKNAEIPYFKWVSANKLQWYDIQKIHLRDIDPFFESCPSLASLDKFNLVLNLNLSKNTYWQVDLDRSSYSSDAVHDPTNTATALPTANVNGNILAGNDATTINAAINTLKDALTTQLRANYKHYFEPKAVSWQSGNATACPFLLGDFSLSRNNNLGTAGVISPADLTGAITVGDNESRIRLKITSEIGWGAGSGKLTNYLYIPQVIYNSAVLSQKIPPEPYQFFTRGYMIDTTTFTRLSLFNGVKSQRKPLNNTFQFVRKIYLIPYMYSVNANTQAKVTLMPYESPLSSAAITNSPVYLNKVKVYQGGKDLMSNMEDNFSPIHLYDNGLYRILNQEGNHIIGNSHLSEQGGLVDKYEWMKGGFSYQEIDMTKFNANDVQDAKSKSFEIQFDVVYRPKTVNDPRDRYCDVVVIVEYEKSFTVDRYKAEFK